MNTENTTQPPQVDVITNTRPICDKEYLVIPTDKFESNYNLDVTAYIEKKNNKNSMEYLSWAYAFLQLKLRHPDLYVVFKDDTDNGGMPFEVKGTTYSTYFTLPYLTDGKKKTPTLYYPILDNSNQSIKYIDSGIINRARMRAAVKAIAIYTGIGLCLFTQEHNLEDSEYSNKLGAVAKINEIVSYLGGASKVSVNLDGDLSVKSMEELREIYVKLQEQYNKQKTKKSTKESVPV